MWSALLGDADEEEEEIEEPYDPEKDYPLHFCVVSGDVKGLKELLKKHKADPTAEEHPSKLPINSLDCHGWSALNVAVLLGRNDCVKLLLNNGAWSRVRNPNNLMHAKHLCMITHNRVALGEVINANKKRFEARLTSKAPKFREELRKGKDFYLELDWNFTTWIPFTGRFCPSDVFRIYKKGDCIRLDYTLVGFENFKWIRGDESIVIKPNKKTGIVECFMIHHDKKEIKVTNKQEELGVKKDGETQLQTELTLQSECICPSAKLDNVLLERTTGYIYGECEEQVGAVMCKQYTMKNVNVSVGHYSEHLPKQFTDAELKKERHLQLEEVMKKVEELETEKEKQEAICKYAAELKYDFEPYEYEKITTDEYFYEQEEPLELIPKGKIWNKDLSVNLAVSDEFPLDLKTDVLPCLKHILYVGNPFLERLHMFLEKVDFGFPVKIEMPLYKVFKATVIFKNCHSAVDKSIFDLPEGYEVKRNRLNDT